MEEGEVKVKRNRAALLKEIRELTVRLYDQAKLTYEMKLAKEASEKYLTSERDAAIQLQQRTHDELEVQKQKTIGKTNIIDEIYKILLPDQFIPFEQFMEHVRSIPDQLGKETPKSKELREFSEELLEGIRSSAKALLEGDDLIALSRLYYLTKLKAGEDFNEYDVQEELRGGIYGT